MSEDDLSGGEMDGEINENETSTVPSSKRKKLWNSFKKKTKPKRWSSKDKNKSNGDPRMVVSQSDINTETNEDDQVDRSEFDSLFDAAKTRRDDKMGFSDSDIPNLKDRSDLNGSGSERPKSLSLDSDNPPSSPTTTSPTETTTKEKTGGKPSAQYVFYVMEVVLREGKDLAVRDKSGTSDPYVKFKLAGKQVYKSRTIYKNLNPKWEESFTIPVENISDSLNIKVYDYDRGASDDSMGAHNVDLSKLPHNKLKNMKLKLTEGTSHEKCGHLVVDFKLIPKTQEEKDAYLARKGQMSQKSKTQSRGGVVSITLIEGIGLIAMDEAGTSDPYVKFRLGNQKYKSKWLPRTTDPKWREQFDLYFYDDQSSVLEVSVWDHDVGSKDDFMGRCTVDLSGLGKEETHTLMSELEDEAGTIHMLLTISGTAGGGDTVSDLANFKVDPDERKAIKTKYSWKNSFKNMKPWDIGWLQVKVIKAQGLSSADIGGKSDPLCVLELVNARLQTHTIYKTLNPEWGKVFTFTVKDIHSLLEITVYDEDRNKSVEFLGKVAIPLLRIRNGERKWYTLKDKKLRGRAKGCIVLEMEVIYNPVKAAVRTFNPREPKYLPDSQKFSRKILMRNINRVKKLALVGVEGGKFIGSCFAWENKARSACAFVAYVVGVYNFQLYLAPIGLLMLFLKNYIVYSVVGGLMKDKDDDQYEDSDDEEDDEVEEDKKSKKKKVPTATLR